MNSRILTFAIVLVILSVAPGSARPSLQSADALQAFGVTTPLPPPWTTPLTPMFEASAAKHNVPIALLETLGFFGSGFENRGDAPTVEGGYGVMALRKNDWGGNSLTLGATLTGVPEETLKIDPAANIEAAAAVLDHYATMWQIDRSKGIEAWLQPVITYAALDAENSKFFAWEVMKRLGGGTDAVNAAGERIQIATQSIGSVDLASLMPAGVTTQSPDYGPAIWDPAATCNYDASTHSSDTVVIHSMEGSLAGTRSWFKNCDHGTLGPSSCTYNIGYDGTIVQMVLESQTAWDVGCYNSRSVGIEHEGYAAMSAWPNAEYVASAALTRDICNRRGIPKKKTTVGPGIVSHQDVTNCCCGTHTDPGNGWNWNYYIAQVNSNGMPSVYDFDWTGSRTAEKHNANAMMNHSECSENVDIFYPFNSDGSRTAEQWLKWQVTPNLTGRGSFHTDVMVPCGNGVSKPMFRMLKADGTDKGPTISVDECPINGWAMLYDGYSDMNIGGWRTDTLDWSRCSVSPPAYGSDPGGAGRMHMYGDQWKYVDDWTVVGPFTTVNAIGDNPAGFDEANLYLYPAVDTTHGNVLGFGGKTPGRVTTGNAGDGASYLEIQNRYPAYYGTSCAVYAASWIHVPTTAAPMFDIGSDDGCKLWLDQNNFWTNDASRACVYDQDVTSSVGISQSATGWHRVLFKIRNGVGGFGGTLSLRNGGDNRWNERSVDMFDLGGYKSYGLGYEQDAWYPTITVSSFNSTTSPANGAAFYGNNPRVPASGTAAAQGPVPLWQVMWYKNGYGTGGDTNYAATGLVGSSWIFTDSAGIGGHTQYRFFAVSKSHRTSFQGSGISGGSDWSGGGHGAYFDAYIDNLAPVDPSFSAVTAADEHQIAISWAIPADQGVGIGPGAEEYASAGSENAYRRGDVGVSVRRNGVVVRDWGTGTSFADTGLAPNTAYAYDIAARDNTSRTRGAWNNITAYVGAVTRWTLSTPPSVASITCDRPLREWQSDSGFTFTAVGGFGAGTLDHYHYAWDKNATHTFTGSEASWSSGTLALTAASEGEWYLHVRGVNGEGVANGTLDLGPYRYSTSQPADTIGAALADPGARPVSLRSKSVTAALPGMFWLEEADRTAAVKVVSVIPVNAGDLVNVSGAFGVSGSQRAVLADTVEDLGAATPPSPVFLTVRELGGSNLNSATPGVTTTKGLYNIGMLVRTAGSVTYVNSDDPNAKYFYLDDGSGVLDDSGHAGVKVLCGAIDPPTSITVTITGIVSSEQTGAKIVPVLVIVKPGDVRPV